MAKAESRLQVVESAAATCGGCVTCRWLAQVVIVLWPADSYAHQRNVLGVRFAELIDGLTTPHSRFSPPLKTALGSIAYTLLGPASNCHDWSRGTVSAQAGLSGWVCMFS